MAGYNNCRHDFCPDCGGQRGEHDPYCDAEDLGVHECPKCKREKVLAENHVLHGDPV